MSSTTNLRGSPKTIAPHSATKRLNLSESIIAGIVAIVDATLVLASGAAILAYYVNPADINVSLYALALILTTYVVLHFFTIFRLYRFERVIRPWSQFPRILGACTTAFTFLVVLAFLLKASESFSRVWALTWLLSAAVLVALGRWTIAWLLKLAGAQGLLTRRIIIFGHTEAARDYMLNMILASEPWNEVVGLFDDRKSRLGPATELRDLSGNLDDLIASARRKRVDEIFISIPWYGSNERIEEILSRLSVLPARVNLYVSDALARRLDQDIHKEYNVTVRTIYERPMTGWQALLKRVFDILVSSIVLLLLSPVFLIVALAIKLDSPGPVFFRQDRFGFNDELIPVWKFRTMHSNQTDRNAERLATANDPRVTKVGRILRKTSLDELPQLFNVLNGSMSLVGPRPHATRAKAGDRLYQEVIEGYGSRHRVKPGITGWAQVNGWRGETDTDEKIIRRVEHDLYYISHWSIWLDIQILLRTIRVVLKADNAY